MRRITPLVSWTAFVVLLAFAVVQNRQALSLRAEAARQSEALATAPPAQVASPPAASGAPLELLQWRNQVSQLTARKRDLQGVTDENAKLRAIASAAASNPGGLPANYVRMNDARWVGMTTPDHTLQSLMWAIRSQDIAALTNLLTPKSAEQVSRVLSNGLPQDVWDTFAEFPGMRIARQTPQPDGSVEVIIEVAPGMPNPLAAPPLHMHRINGEWKINDL